MIYLEVLTIPHLYNHLTNHNITELHQVHHLLTHFCWQQLAVISIGRSRCHAAVLQDLSNLAFDPLQGVGRHGSRGGGELGFAVTRHRHNNTGEPPIDGTAGEGCATRRLHMPVEGLVPVGEQLKVGAIPGAVGVQQHQHQV